MCRTTRLIILTFILFVLFTLLAKAATSQLITGWVRVAPLPQPIAYLRAVAYGSEIYVVGGEVPNWTTPVAAVLQAQVESNGSIQQWMTPSALAIPPFPVSLNRHALVLARGERTDSLYVIGGFSLGNRYAQVWRANLASNAPSISEWQEVRNYPRKIIYHEAVYANGYIYVLGGLGEDDRPLQEVYSAKLINNGNLEAWRAEKELPKPLYHFASVNYAFNCNKHYLYAIGGYDGSQARRNIYMSEIDSANGVLGKWEEKEPLPRAIAYQQAFIYHNHLVVIGGSGSDGSYNEVYSAFIKADGSLEPWVTETDLPDSISSFTVVPVTFSNAQFPALYVLGGQNGNDRRSQVYYAEPLSPSFTPRSSASGYLYLPLIQRC